jgi:hypothetical protein
MPLRYYGMISTNPETGICEERFSDGQVIDFVSRPPEAQTRRQTDGLSDLPRWGRCASTFDHAAVGASFRVFGSEAQEACQDGAADFAPAGLAVHQCSSPYHRLIWSKASMLNRFVHSRGMDLMTTLQAIGFGAMLAWTPSVVLMVWMLWETPLDVLD